MQNLNLVPNANAKAGMAAQSGKKPSEPMAKTSLIIPAALKQQVKIYCLLHGRQMSEFFATALQHELERSEKEDKPEAQ